MPHLENWSILYLDTVSIDSYTAPELIPSVLHGEVYNHPSPYLPDGVWMHSAKLESIDLKERTAKTKDSEYTLGEPDPEWIAWCREHKYSVSEILQEGE